MKHIKTFAFFALFLSVLSVSAQTAKTSWPKLNDVKEVTARIQYNLDQNNVQAAFSFTETLVQHVQQLNNSEAPAMYKNKQTEASLKQLSIKSEELNKKAVSRAPEAQLRQSFQEIQAILDSMVDAKKSK